MEPGEQVVIEGSQNVRPNGKVRIDDKPRGDAPATPAAPGGTTGVTPGSAASSEGVDIRSTQRERA